MPAATARRTRMSAFVHSSTCMRCRLDIVVTRGIDCQVYPRSSCPRPAITTCWQRVLGRGHRVRLQADSDQKNGMTLSHVGGNRLEKRGYQVLRGYHVVNRQRPDPQRIAALLSSYDLVGSWRILCHGMSDLHVFRASSVRYGSSGSQGNPLIERRFPHL
jgi:hypothetical protein